MRRQCRVNSYVYSVYRSRELDRDSITNLFLFRLLFFLSLLPAPPANIIISDEFPPFCFSCFTCHRLMVFLVLCVGSGGDGGSLILSRVYYNPCVASDAPDNAFNTRTCTKYANREMFDLGLSMLYEEPFSRGKFIVSFPPPTPSSRITNARELNGERM